MLVGLCEDQMMTHPTTSHPLPARPRCEYAFPVGHKALQSHGNVGITATQMSISWHSQRREKYRRLTWYLRCFRLCLDRSAALTACESASVFRCDFKLLTLFVKAFSTTFRISGVSSLLVFSIK